MLGMAEFDRSKYYHPSEFAGTAGHLGISEKDLEDPLVREFVDLLTKVQILQIELSRARTKNPRFHALPPNISIDLPDRYRAAEMMLRGVSAIMKEGLGEYGGTVDKTYMTVVMNQALLDVGLEVRPKDSTR